MTARRTRRGITTEPARGPLPPRWSNAARLALAWTGVLVLSGAVRAVAGSAMVWPALWALTWVSVVLLAWVQGAARPLVWAVLHAASHVCWITGHPTGWTSVAVAVPALAASVSLGVLWRGSAGAWFAGATTVAGLVAAVDRLLGGVP